MLVAAIRCVNHTLANCVSQRMMHSVGRLSALDDGGESATGSTASSFPHNLRRVSAVPSFSMAMYRFRFPQRER